MRGADGDQPSSSFTIRVSVATGPRRSRTSLYLRESMKRLHLRWVVVVRCGGLAALAAIGLSAQDGSAARPQSRYSAGTSRPTPNPSLKSWPCRDAPMDLGFGIF